MQGERWERVWLQPPDVDRISVGTEGTIPISPSSKLDHNMTQSSMAMESPMKFYCCPSVKLLLPSRAHAPRAWGLQRRQGG